MTAITTLRKRLDRLEDKPTTEPDFVEIVLAALSDDDLELLHEHAVLRESGFDEVQAASMMGERWRRYQEATVHFQESYQKTLNRTYKGFSSGTA